MNPLCAQGILDQKLSVVAGWIKGMTTTRDELDTASAVLSFARDSRIAADRAEADLLVAAVTWAEQHPPESIHEAATWATRGGDCPLPLAGEGAPLVAEFCIAEFAARSVGQQTVVGRRSPTAWS